MAAILFRLVLLALGMGLIEIGLGPALIESSVAGWLLVLVVGVPLTVAGSAGFIAPLLGGRGKGSNDA